MKAKQKTRWLLTGVYTVALAVVSLLSGDLVDETPDLFPHQDKAGHFIAYAVYALLLAWSWQARRTITALALAAIVVYCTAYGVAMEWLQALLRPGDRMFSLADMAANGMGAVVCVVVFRRRSVVIGKRVR